MGATEDAPTLAHTPEQERVIREYEAAVDENLVAFAETAIENKQGKVRQYIIQPVSDRAVDEIKAYTGVDATGFRVVISTNDINHIEGRHGETGSNDNSMADVSDIGRIPYILNNYDSIDSTGKTSAYLNQDGTPSVLLRLEKKIDGFHYVVEAVPDTAKKQIHIISSSKSNRQSVDTGMQSPPVYAQGDSTAQPAAGNAGNNNATVPT
ncbi:MAG: hypothetical protein LBT60_01880, partial [Oscillospiraceae bacterium]|nr:hypothetical protein [Oscillospiraceae bacterium]